MTTFIIPDMSCDHCKARVEKAMHSVDATAELHFTLDAQRVTVQSAASVLAMQQALQAAGYPATLE